MSATKIDLTTIATENTLNGIRGDRDKARILLQDRGILVPCETATVSGGYRVKPGLRASETAYADEVKAWRALATEFNAATAICARFAKALAKATAKQDKAAKTA